MTETSVLVTSYYDPAATEPALARLRQHGAQVKRINLGRRLTFDELVREAQGASALLISDERIDGELLDALPSLRIVCCDGVGVDHVDLPAATQRGVIVTNCPVVHEANGEFVIGLIVAVMRKLLICDRGVRAGRWTERRDYVGKDLRGSTLGLLGFGRVGRSVGGLARAFGMNVIAHWPSGSPAAAREHDVTFVSLDDLLANCDVLSIHVPLKDSTRELIGRRQIAKMKDGSYLINSSRGAVVDEAALVEALRSGKLAAAGIDVFCDEPPPTDHPLLSSPNVIVSPHAGSDSAGTFARVFDCAVDDMLLFFAGQRPRNVVNSDVR